MPQRKYVSTDPGYGSDGGRKYVSTDPTFGESQRDGPPREELRNAPERTWRDYMQEYFGGQSGSELLTGGTLSSFKPFREWYQGTPERNQARAEGLPMDAPTPADMVTMATVTLGAGAGAPGAMREMFREGAPAAAGQAGGVGRETLKRVLSHPRAKAAGIGSVPGILDMDPKEALEGAALGAFLGGDRPAAPGAPPPRVPSAPPEGKLPPGAVWPPKAPPGKYWRQGVDGSVTLEPIPATPSRPTAPPQEAPPRSQPAPATTRPDAGRAVATAHNAKMSFAKEAAKSNPKIGEKIWMELDDAGNPVRVLTPDQAGAAKRRGVPTTWVKNLWPSAAR